jgi:mRNA interferase RelE/StbE
VKALPPEVRAAVKKQLDFMADDPRHPSLRLKRIQGTADWWEARVNDSYRFGLKHIDGVWVLVVVGSHQDVLGR